MVNLTAILEDKVTIHLDWLAAEESIHDHYVVEHRSSLRDSNALWVVNSTLSTNLTLPNLFPGERYEMQVYAVKNDAKSEKQNISQVTGNFVCIVFHYINVFAVLCEVGEAYCFCQTLPCQL